MIRDGTTVPATPRPSVISRTAPILDRGRKESTAVLGSFSACHPICRDFTTSVCVDALCSLTDPDKIENPLPAASLLAPNLGDASRDHHERVFAWSGPIRGFRFLRSGQGLGWEELLGIRLVPGPSGKCWRPASDIDRSQRPIPCQAESQTRARATHADGVGGATPPAVEPTGLSK